MEGRGQLHFITLEQRVHVVEEAVAHVLVDAAQDLHVRFVPVLAEVLGLQLEQLQHVQGRCRSSPGRSVTVLQ